MELKTALHKPTVKVYVGAEEIKLIFADIILTKNNFRAIISWDDLTRILGAKYIFDFVDTQVNHFLRLRLLTPTGETWAEMLARDVVLVGDKCDGIVFLPNWHKSRGAKLEAFTGLLCGKKFQLFSEDYAEGVSEVSADYVRRVLVDNMP